MSTHVRIDDQHLVVHLSRRDRIFALRRDPRIPLTDIERVESVSDGRAAVTGVRAPGLGVPFVRMIGTWRSAAGSTFAVVRGGGPAVVVTTRTARPRRIVISDSQAAVRATELATELETRLAGVAR